MKHLAICRKDLPVKLNFGCGTKIKTGWWNVDATIGEFWNLFVDSETCISEGIIQSPHALPNNHFKEIFSEMVFEHIHPDMIANTLFCLYHFLKPEGKIEIIVPNFYYLAKELVQLEEQNKNVDLRYMAGMRSITNEMLDPTFEDHGFLHGHQSIWTKRIAIFRLASEGYEDIHVEEISNGIHLKITAWKPKNNPYGIPFVEGVYDA